MPLTNFHNHYQNCLKTIRYSYSFRISKIGNIKDKINITGILINSGQFDEPEYFGKEMVLSVNLGPLHLFSNLVDEVLASNTDKSYLRKESRIYQKAKI